MIEGSLKTHQAALGEGKSVHPNVNDSSLSQQLVDLQIVDRLHVPDGVAGGGDDALNVRNKGLNSTVGLSTLPQKLACKLGFRLWHKLAWLFTS